MQVYDVIEINATNLVYNQITFANLSTLPLIEIFLLLINKTTNILQDLTCFKQNLSYY